MSDDSGILSYHVEWFVSQTALSDVTIRIGGGKLLGVEQGRTDDAIDLGSVALIDGLVNVHTHLEFSCLTSPIPPSGRFTDWIRAVIQHRGQFPDDVADSIQSGIRESLQSGTTLVGEIATRGWTRADYDQHSFCGVVFQELLGLSPERVIAQRELASSHAVTTDGRVEWGLSPHAPYSTHLDLVRHAVQLAQERNCGVAIHLAESLGELELMSQGTGEFREFLESLNLWRDDPGQFGRSPTDYLKILSQAPRALIVHGNYLTDQELTYLASQPQMTLVYCPRTHASFRHAPHPWRRAVELGVNVALGTDSRASNPDLSLFSELQFLASRHPSLPHVELLRHGASNGRRALGFEAGNNANLTLVRLADAARRHAEPKLFHSDNEVCGTMIDGCWVWQDL